MNSGAPEGQAVPAPLTAPVNYDHSLVIDFPLSYVLQILTRYRTKWKNMDLKLKPFSIEGIMKAAGVFLQSTSAY